MTSRGCLEICRFNNYTFSAAKDSDCHCSNDDTNIGVVSDVAQCHDDMAVSHIGCNYSIWGIN